jgi:NAD(P)-dependent dehydrogenase (short-subunit alcohol dehydrogenase family)
LTTIDASELLRPGLLEGVSLVLAGVAAAGGDEAGDGAQASLGAAVRAACLGLGARAYPCEIRLDASADGEDLASAIERTAEQAADLALEHAGSIELLVVDCASVFAHAAAAGRGADRDARRARDALTACLDASWNVTRTIANRAFLPAGGGDGVGGGGGVDGGEGARGGRIVYLAPPADGDEHVDAALAGLENLARTLSIEWARHGVASVAIASAAGMADEVAALTAYLASPAGAYYSGCLLDLRGAGGGVETPIRSAV